MTRVIDHAVRAPKRPIPRSIARQSRLVGPFLNSITNVDSRSRERSRALERSWDGRSKDNRNSVSKAKLNENMYLML